jgi:hypothetical protein
MEDRLEVNPARHRSVMDYRMPPVVRTEHVEGSLTRLLEQQAAKIPSDVFLFTALAAMAAAVGLELAGRRDMGRFVGLWPTPLLVMGVYNKLVKTLAPR